MTELEKSVIEKAILCKELIKTKRRMSFLFGAGLIMTLLLNIVLVMTLINRAYDLSLIVLITYILHDVFHRRAAHFADEDYKMLIKEAKRLIPNLEKTKQE